MSQTRCLSCMAELSSFPCSVCGADKGELADNQLYLPLGIILNNRYLIGKVIGIGGFGAVYLGWDTNLDVRVAVKEFFPKDIASRSNDHVNLIPYAGNGMDDLNFGIKKFLEEAKALARFQDHPGIVKVNESFKANNTAYMVMQYLDGMTLKDYLKRQPGERISFDIAIKALTPIMDALREVHKTGFVHRDISPDNIFITTQKQVKLLDFGAARYAMGEHSKSLTSILKHGYAPVEQYSTKGNQGPWTDVYAVAATLYRCITGEIPPDAMDRMQVESIRSPKQMGIEVPVQLELALMKGLALRASDRFESIEALQREFAKGAVEKKKVVEEPKQVKPVAVVAPAIRRPKPEIVLPEPTPKKSNFMIMMIAVICIVVGVGWYLMSKGSLVYTDTQTGLMWTRNGNIAGRQMNWNEAMNWAKSLNYAGYSDWRLPTKDELEAFAKRGGNRPSEWLNANGFNNTKASYYWSSTTDAINPFYALYVHFGNGSVYYDNKGSSFYVRCVRGGQ